MRFNQNYDIPSEWMYWKLFYLKEIRRVLIGWYPLNKFPYPMAMFFNLLF